MKKLNNAVKTVAIGSASTLALVAGSVHAAIPADATAALTEATSDVSTIGWAVFGVIIAAMAFKYMRRAL